MWGRKKLCNEKKLSPMRSDYLEFEDSLEYDIDMFDQESSSELYSVSDTESDTELEDIYEEDIIDIKKNALTLEEYYKNFGEKVEKTRLGNVISKTQINKIEHNFREIGNVKYINQKYLPEYPLGSDCLIVKSCMGSGKTTQLNIWLKKLISSYGYSSVIISPRVVFTKNMKNALNQTLKDSKTKKGKKIKYHDYEEKGFNKYDHIFCQVESLHKIKTDRDIIVVDELNTILECFNSPYNKENLEINKCVFRTLLMNAKRILVADAFLEINNLKFLKSFIEKPIDIIYNQYENRNEYKLYSVQEETQFVDFIKEATDDNKKFCVISNTKAFLNHIRNNSLIDFENKNILQIDSENNRDCIGKLDEELLTQYDIVLFSPTVSAGIDLNFKHFDKIFVYAQPSIYTCNHFYLAQMTGRIRHLYDKEIYFFSKMNSGKQPITFDEIVEKEEKQMNEHNKTLTRYFNRHYVKEDVSLLKNRYYYRLSLDNPWVKLNIYKNIIDNKALNNFRYEYLSLLAESGYQIFNIKPEEYNSSEDDEEIKETDNLKNNIKSSIQKAKKDTLEQKQELFKNAQVIEDPEQINDLDNNMKTNNYSVEDLYTLKKSKLFKNFNHEYLRDNNIYNKINDEKIIKFVINMAFESNFDNIISNVISQDVIKVEEFFINRHKIKSSSLICIREIIKMFGLKNSFDTETNLDFNSIKNDSTITTYFNDNFDFLKSIFRTETKKDNKLLYIKKLSRCIFKNFSGFVFTPGRGKQRQICNLKPSFDLDGIDLQGLINSYNFNTDIQQELRVRKCVDNKYFYTNVKKINGDY